MEEPIWSSVAAHLLTCTREALGANLSRDTDEVRLFLTLLSPSRQMRG
jgi:hypothetical protein